ncbi:SdpI family protein [Streptobacillus felis]|uniref:SdpI family protein n=1 Tax=Streptobacillus felis TaxID=1384509 RepID=UPI0008338044|nr:SdpI family protein [Streptobacillus felis]
MFNKKKIIISIILCLIPMVFGLTIYSKLPEMIPSHFNLNGEVDGYSSKKVFIFGLPLLFAFMNAFLAFSIKEDPKNIENNKTFLYKNSIWLLPIISNFVFFSTYLMISGYNINVGKIIHFPIGLLFIVLGNYLPKCKQSYTIGIRTPWTLNDEENWNKTHRFGGKMFVISGILMMASILIPNIFLISFIPLILPVIYSYLLYKKIVK